MSYLQLNHIKKTFGDTQVIKGVDLEIQKGEFIVFVGPSGCGKSTLLRLIAGLEQITSGSLVLDGHDITKTPSGKRGLAMVFQSYALYPHMTVFDNMSFALKLAGESKDEIRKKVEYAGKTLNLTEYLGRTPKELSGGQRQRVAIGRAIVRAPKVFLFDEPLSNLDAKLRVQVRETIREIQQRLGITTVFVTHDQEEALSIADRVAVMSGGRIEQLARPEDLYRLPRTTFVAGFIGTMNVFDSGPVDGAIPMGDGGALPCVSFSGRSGDSCWVRPEDIQITDAGAPGTGRAAVLRVIPRGHYREVLLQSHGTHLRAFTDDDPQPEQVVGVRATRALVYSDGLLVEDDETVAPEGMSVGLGKDRSA